MSDITSVNLPRDWFPLSDEWPREFYNQQWDFINSVSDYWEIIFQAGNGTGKTLILYWSATALALGLHPKQRSIGMPPLRFKVLVNDFEHGMNRIALETLFRPTHLDKVKKEIGPIMPASMVDKMWSKEDKSLYLKNGSRFEFMTSEQKRSQHSGTTFDILLCDEEPAEPQYDESVRGLRTAKGGGRVFWSFTPPWEMGKGPSWSKEKKLDLVESGEAKDIKIIRACMRDNPAVDEDFIRKFSRGKTEEQLRVQLDGSYPTFGKMIFPLFSDRLWHPRDLSGNLIPVSWQPPWDDEEGKFEFALDWHPSKPTAALWTYEDKGGDIYVFDELSPQATREKTIAEISRIILEIEGHPHQRPRIMRIADPKLRDKSNALVTGFNAWEAFRHAGIFFREGYNRQPEVGISIINDFIQGNRKEHPRLFIRENCVNLRKSMRNHYWTEDGKPDPKWSDYPICLRYILQRKGRRTTPMQRKTGGRWPLTSIGSDPRFGPYTGVYARERHG